MKTFLNLDAPISTLLEPNTVFFIRPRCEDVKQAAEIINKLQEDGVGLLFRCDCRSRLRFRSSSFPLSRVSRAR